MNHDSSKTMPAPEIVRDRLEQWFNTQVPGWRNVRVAPLELSEGAGWSADLFFVDVTYEENSDTRTRSLAVRRQGQTFDLVLGGDLSFQAQMMEGLAHCRDLPVAEFVGIEHSDTLLGAPFLVMERVEGQVAPQRPNYNIAGWLTERTPAQRRAAWRNAIEAFARLHRHDWRDGFTFLDRPERGKPGLDQYVGYLREWYDWAVKGRDVPVLKAALDYVVANQPADAQVAVVWGDPTPSNTLYRPDGSVAALIDWELGALGPGEMDLAWWLYFDELFSAGFGYERLPGLPDRDEVIAMYEQAAGRQVEHMPYYDILTGLRMGIVAVRQFDRQVWLGNIPAENRSLTDNQMTVYLARKLGLEVPVLGADFAAFVAKLTPVKEAS